ncbi:MAG: putative integral rane protein, partial [Frankiales bacterium]|nr:putative integral rane protein [Frankiales bacterium]
EASSAPYAVLAGLVLAALTHSPVLRVGGLLYALAAGLLVLLSDPFGSNVLRLGLLLAAPLVVATATEHWRLVAPITAVLVLWQVQPPYADLRAARPPSFVALNRALVEQEVKRVEVVPLRDHGEAAFVAPVVPLARGWSRQVDTDRNRLFYDGPLSAQEYEQWLRDNGVDAVALGPSARADVGGQAERALLLIGSVEGLEKTWSDDQWTVWRFNPAQPLAEFPVQVLDTDRVSVRLRSPSAADVELKVRWSRWLSVTGPACVERAGGGTRVRFSGPGEAVVSSRLSLRPVGHC